MLRYNKTMLKLALCFFLLIKSCGPPNDIISFFGPRLKMFADPWSSSMVHTAVNAKTETGHLDWYTVRDTPNLLVNDILQ